MGAQPANCQGNTVRGLQQMEPPYVPTGPQEGCPTSWTWLFFRPTPSWLSPGRYTRSIVAKDELKVRARLSIVVLCHGRGWIFQNGKPPLFVDLRQQCTGSIMHLRLTGTAASPLRAKAGEMPSKLKPRKTKQSKNKTDDRWLTNQAAVQPKKGKIRALSWTLSK